MHSPSLLQKHLEELLGSDWSAELDARVAALQRTRGGVDRVSAKVAAMAGFLEERKVMSVSEPQADHHPPQLCTHTNPSVGWWTGV